MRGLIMEFIPGRTVEESDFKKLSCLKGFAEFLQRLHLSQMDFPEAASPFKRFRDFCEKTSKFPPRFSEVKHLMGDLESLFHAFPSPKAPSHLDLHPLNIMLSDNQFFLVDWVNGGLSDPYFDLGTFSVFHGLNQERAQQFLTYYFEREPTKIEWDRFIVAQPVRLFVIAAALLSFDKPYIPIYQQAVSLIDRDSFKSSLCHLKNSIRLLR